MKKLRACCAIAVVAALPLAAAAQNVTVNVTNNQPAGGFTFSPVWFGFHDGTFDAFDAGAAASSSVEAVAELGDGSGLTSDLGGAGVSGTVMSPNAPPPFIPGESGSATMNVGDSTVNRYFSFGSMLVPSNDFFLGNDDPMAYEVFDAGGNFNGPLTIQVFARDAWDAGTEENDLSDGPAFIVGQNAGDGSAEGGVVLSLFNVPGVDTYLNDIVGMETPIGDLTDGLTPDELVATIEITPEPASLALLGMGGLSLLRRRRR